MYRGVFLAGCLLLASCQMMSPEPRQADPQLLSSMLGTWQLESLNGQAIPASSQAHIVFHDNTRLAGNSGCNQFMGRYQLRGVWLHLTGNIAQTRMLCPPAAMQTERDLLQLLQAPWQASVRQDIFRLTDPDGRVKLQARKVVE